MKFFFIITLSIQFFIKVVQAEEFNIDNLEGGSLFLQQKERNIDYQLLTGKINFREEDSGEFTEGYYASSSFMIEGDMKRNIYDFKEEYSSLQINDHLISLLKNSDYTILFACEKRECGELVAWSSMVSSYIVGSEDTQRIVAAKKVFKNMEVGYVFYHLADIEREPRLFMDYIETLPIDINQQNKSQPLVLSFESNSSQISEINVDILDEVAAVIKNNSEKDYIVIGHTDNTGTVEHNALLSVERANVIKNYLVEKHDISPDLIHSKGVGSGESKSTNLKTSGRKANRRVEITQL